AGAWQVAVRGRARAGVTYTAAVPAVGFRPVELRGAQGALAAVAAAEAQVGWPYVWGGESRAEGGFDCSGLIDYAYTAAGLPLPGRPTASDLWHLAAPEPPDAPLPGDLVLVGAATGAPHPEGVFVGAGGRPRPGDERGAAARAARRRGRRSELARAPGPRGRHRRRAGGGPPRADGRRAELPGRCGPQDHRPGGRHAARDRPAAPVGA